MSGPPAATSGSRPPVSTSARQPAADDGPGGSAVDRVADVLLRFLDASGATLGVTELATDLGLSKAVVHRIVSALTRRGLLGVDVATRRYRLGPATLALGEAFLAGTQIRELARPGLRQLSHETNETATLSVRTGDHRIYVDQVGPDREVIMSVSVGVPYPLHAGASSKAFLAFLPEGELAAVLAGPLELLTDRTVVEPDRLRTEIRRIRGQGYAASDGERQPGSSSVAAPVFDHLGRVAAVMSVCGPTDRFRAERDQHAAALLHVTGSLSAALGHRAAGRPTAAVPPAG